MVRYLRVLSVESNANQFGFGVPGAVYIGPKPVCCPRQNDGIETYGTCGLLASGFCAVTAAKYTWFKSG